MKICVSLFKTETMENGQNMYRFSITPSSQTCRLTFAQRFQKFIHSLFLAKASVVI
jgi:hypothetical protein